MVFVHDRIATAKPWRLGRTLRAAVNGALIATGTQPLVAPRVARLRQPAPFEGR